MTNIKWGIDIHDHGFVLHYSDHDVWCIHFFQILALVLVCMQVWFQTHRLKYICRKKKQLKAYLARWINENVFHQVQYFFLNDVIALFFKRENIRNWISESRVDFKVSCCQLLSAIVCDDWWKYRFIIQSLWEQKFPFHRIK